MMIECCNCTYREKICTIFTFVPLKIPPMHRLLQSFKRSRKEKNVLQTLFCDNLIDSWPTKRLPFFFALTPLYLWSRSLNYICDCSASIHRCFNIGPLRNNTLHYRCSVQFFIHIHHTKELLSNQDQWSSAYPQLCTYLPTASARSPLSRPRVQRGKGGPTNNNQDQCMNVHPPTMYHQPDQHNVCSWGWRRDMVKSRDQTGRQYNNSFLFPF